jgi:hypothetical protein
MSYKYNFDGSILLRISFYKNTINTFLYKFKKYFCFYPPIVKYFFIYSYDCDYDYDLI